MRSNQLSYAPLNCAHYSTDDPGCKPFVRDQTRRSLTPSLPDLLSRTCGVRTRRLFARESASAPDLEYNALRNAGAIRPVSQID